MYRWIWSNYQKDQIGIDNKMNNIDIFANVSATILGSIFVICMIKIFMPSKWKKIFSRSSCCSSTSKNSDKENQFKMVQALEDAFNRIFARSAHVRKTLEHVK